MSVVVAVVALALATTPARGHHVGTYAPRDNEISANFKQLKFSLQAGKFDVALRLFDTGALRTEMQARASSLPAGLEAGTRAALLAKDGAEAERRLMIFFAALARDLALDGLRQLAHVTGDAESRAAAARKFVEAIWRYYNLVDFAVSQRDPKAAVAIRLALDDAENALRPTPRVADSANPDRLSAPLSQIATTLNGLIEASGTPRRRES